MVPFEDTLLQGLETRCRRTLSLGIAPFDVFLGLLFREHHLARILASVAPSSMLPFIDHIGGGLPSTYVTVMS